MSNSIDIFARSVCLSLTLTAFTVQRKGDKNKIETDADKALVTFGKKILDSPELKAIKSLDAEIYSYLNWREGQRSLPFELKRLQSSTREGQP